MLYFNYDMIPPIDGNPEILEPIAELYQETWYATNLPFGTYLFEPDFIRYWIKTYCDEEYLFASFRDEKITGILLGKIVNLHVRIKPKEGLPKKEILKGYVIGGAAMDKKFRRSHHMANIFNTLTEHVQRKGFDLILTFPQVESGIIDSLQKSMEFEIYNKKANSFIGFLTEERLKLQEEIQGKDFFKKFMETISIPFIFMGKPFEALTGPLTKRSIKISPVKLEKNKFQEAEVADYQQIVDILNGYNQKIEFNQIWTLKEFLKYVDGSLLLREMEKEEPGKYSFHIKVWKEKDEVKAFTTISKRKTYYNGGIIPTVYFDLFGFKQGAIINDKIKFFMSVIDEVMDYRPKVCAIKINGCFHEIELMNELNFRPVSSDKNFLIRRLSKKADIIKELKNIDQFNVPVVDF